MSRAWNTNASNKPDPKNSFSSSGLASNLPSVADVGRRINETSEGGSWGRGNENQDDGWKGKAASSGSAVYRAPQKSEATWGSNTTTTYARPRQRQDEPSEDVDDKWSKAFKSSGRPAFGSGRERESSSNNASSEPLAVNSRASGFGSAPGGGEERPQRSERSSDRPYGEGREGGGRNFGDRPSGEGREGGGRNFGSDRPPREPREAWGESEERRGPPRGEGGRGGGGEDRPFRGEREPRGEDGGRRPPFERERRGFGNGDARNYRGGEGGGRGGGRGGRGDGDREWESDPRFAGKFGRDLNPRFDSSNRGEKSWDAPLPTAPKASLDGGKTGGNAADSPIPIFKVVEGKSAKSGKKPDQDSGEKEKKVEKQRADEEARRAKIEAENAAKEEQLNSHSSSYTATMDGIKAGLKGKALTEQVKSTLSGSSPLSCDGVLKAVLESLNDDYSVRWHDAANYGNLLSASTNKSQNDQISLLYTVQEYCHSKKFPKIDLKGNQKKLIEHLITTLLVAEFVDVEGIVAWADDESDNDYRGRSDAIIQTTGMIATLRDSLLNEESDADSEDDFDAPQAHI